jgi:large subunit ribosomal protein L23
MGLLDKLTTKKDQKKDFVKPKENVLDMVKEPAVAASSDKQEVKLKDDTGLAHKILISYHLSEKSNVFSTQSRYVFKVHNNANKIEVKKAVEKVYDVHVIGVNMINTKGKSRRQGRVVGTTSDWKKAVVTLKEGEKISGLAEGV